MEDSAIIELYFARDEQGLTESMKKYGSYCRTIALNVLGDKNDAEETVNDAYFAAWNKIPPENPLCLRAFLGKITRNLSLSRHRDKTRGKRGGGEVNAVYDELENMIAEEEDVSAALEKKELSAAVNRFLHSIDGRDCDIFLARYYFMYKTSEIALKFGLSDAHVRTVLSRKRNELKDFLTKEGLM